MPIVLPNKDPDDVLDYILDWANRIDDGDTIASSTWIIDAGLLSPADTYTGTTTTIWLSGGTLGNTYSLTNRITTSGGRIMDQDVRITISEN